jgi:multiple sugar transport system ATP-binding protein
MVFQNYALYPHMNVYENMSFGLKLKKTPKAEIDRRVKQAAQILDITELLERKPKQLSGGQRQRVAMGRAIVRDPKVFLFDEPLSNLDAKLRVQMRTEIKKVHQKVRTTTVYVTHDQVEAMTLADRVVVMNAGLIEQVGSPNELYHSPATKFVAGFIGSPAMNFIPCHLEQAAGALRVPATTPVSASPTWCWGCGPSTSSKRGRTSSRTSTISSRRSTWSNRWAWRRWSISRSTAPRSAAGSIPMPAPRKAAR